MRRSCLWGLGLCIALLAETPAVAKPRIWTDHVGRQLKAEFVRVHEGNVILKAAGGTVKSIPVESFSDADRKYLSDLTGEDYEADEEEEFEESGPAAGAFPGRGNNPRSGPPGFNPAAGFPAGGAGGGPGMGAMNVPGGMPGPGVPAGVPGSFPPSTPRGGPANQAGNGPTNLPGGMPGGFPPGNDPANGGFPPPGLPQGGMAPGGFPQGAAPRSGRAPGWGDQRNEFAGFDQRMRDQQFIPRERNWNLPSSENDELPRHSPAYYLFVYPIGLCGYACMFCSYIGLVNKGFHQSTLDGLVAMFLPCFGWLWVVKDAGDSLRLWFIGLLICFFAGCVSAIVP